MIDAPAAPAVATPRRRFFERANAGTPTVIGENTVLMGDIRGKGTFVVYGEVQGDGDIHGSLNLGASGRWQGHVHARDAVVAGHVYGSLIIEGKLEIGYTAVIHGRVSARSISIARGAIVDGDISTTSGEPVEHFDEKRG